VDGYGAGGPGNENRSRTISRLRFFRYGFNAKTKFRKNSSAKNSPSVRRVTGFRQRFDEPRSVSGRSAGGSVRGIMSDKFFVNLPLFAVVLLDCVGTQITPVSLVLLNPISFTRGRPLIAEVEAAAAAAARRAWPSDVLSVNLSKRSAVVGPRSNVSESIHRFRFRVLDRRIECL